MSSIFAAWEAMSQFQRPAQRRIDSSHPCDLYADFDPPDQPGLILVTDAEIPVSREFRFIRIESRLRSDQRWVFRLQLTEPSLVSVFGELCQDLVDSSRTYTASKSQDIGKFVWSRLERWHSLLMLEHFRLDRAGVLGLIAELCYMERVLIPKRGPEETVRAWVGPLRIAQDFRFPSGGAAEVKAAQIGTDSLMINGLNQLDFDPLVLAVVRFEEVTRRCLEATSLERAAQAIRKQLVTFPTVAEEFESLFRLTGADQVNSDMDIFLRVVAIDEYMVDSSFPRLTPQSVPAGVIAADYRIVLPSRKTND